MLKVVLILCLMSTAIALISLARGQTTKRLRPQLKAAFDIFVVDEYGTEKLVKGCKSDFNILVNLKAKGVDAPSSCTNGTCNVCCTEVIEGMENIVAEVEASAFEDELRKRGLILTCVNKCVGPGVRLVLGKEDDV